MIKFRRKLLYVSLEKVSCFFLVCLLVPGIFIFEMSIVLPNLIKLFNAGIPKQVFHIFISMFFFSNITGNMMMSILIDTRLKRLQNSQDSDQHQDSKGSYCEHCKVNRPAKTWHCNKCNVCIIRRNHHCIFLSRCIGLYNQRYYILFLGDVSVAMIYATYYNFYYVTSKFEDSDWMLSAFRIINPLLRVVIPEPMGVRDLCVLFLFCNVGIFVWSAGLFYYHLSNVVRGVTAHEARDPTRTNIVAWRKNLLNVFGNRWYLAVIWPFVDSPLPESAKSE